MDEYKNLIDIICNSSEYNLDKQTTILFFNNSKSKSHNHHNPYIDFSTKHNSNHNKKEIIDLWNRKNMINEPPMISPIEKNSPTPYQIFYKKYTLENGSTKGIRKAWKIFSKTSI